MGSPGKHAQRVLEEATQFGEKGGADGPIDDAVIARQGHRDPFAWRDRAVSHDWNLAYLSDGKDGALGRVDDGGELVDAEHTEIGNGERAVLHLLGLELSAAR